MADLGKEIGWDDAIENEGTEFEPLPEELMNLQWHPWNAPISEEARRWHPVTWRTWTF